MEADDGESFLGSVAYSHCVASDDSTEVAAIASALGEMRKPVGIRSPWQTIVMGTDEWKRWHSGPGPDPSLEPKDGPDPTLEDVLTHLDRLDPKTLLGYVSNRNTTDPYALDAWGTAFTLSEAEARRGRLGLWPDQLGRAAYLGGLLLSRLAPRRARWRTDGYLLLLILAGWNADISCRWYERDYWGRPPSWTGPDATGVDDLLRLWELRELGPALVASFAGHLAEVIADARDIRLLLDRLLQGLEPERAEMAAVVERLNDTPFHGARHDQDNILDRVDIDSAIANVSSGRRPET